MGFSARANSGTASQVDLYLDAAERGSIRRSYASAIQHFEVEWGGLLSGTIDSIARYLAAYAEILSLNTLKHRLAALSCWHQYHGFPDPTKSPEVRQLLKGAPCFFETSATGQRSVSRRILTICSSVKRLLRERQRVTPQPD